MADFVYEFIDHPSYAEHERVVDFKNNVINFGIQNN